MNEHYFDWQVYCIVEEGKRELDKLLDDTKNAIRSHRTSVSFTLEDWIAKMYEAECERQYRLDKLVANVLYGAMNGQQLGDKLLDKAFWRCNIK